MYDYRYLALLGKLDGETQWLDDPVGADHINGARIALLSRRRVERQAHGLGRSGDDAPRLAIKSDLAAMEMRFAPFIQRELVGFAIKGETPAGDAVGIATGNRSDIGGLIEIGFEPVESEHDRSRFTLHLDREVAQDRPIGE